MRFGLSYFLLCLAAKFFTSWTHRLEWSVATPMVLLWQDAVVALVLGAIALRWIRAAQVCYWILAIYLAICMPLLKVMATPLTRPLLDAAGGTLSASFAHYLKFWNLAPAVFMVMAAAFLPNLVRERRLQVAFAIVAIAMVPTGWWLSRGTEVHGLQRNVVVALIGSYFAGPAEWHVVLDSDVYDNCNSLPQQASASGFNVLVVGLESTGSRYLQPYGAAIDPTPRLSELARGGWVLENAYSPYPESIKCLLSVLASRLPKSGLKDADFTKLASPSLATVLVESGYETALFHSGRFMYLGMDALVQSSGFCVMQDAGEIGGDRESSFGVDDQDTVEHILRWLDARRAAKPFYIQYLPITGHHPYEAPAGPWIGPGDESRYLNALNYSDRVMGQLLDGLRDRGLLQKTLVVVYGDHGEAFGEHFGNYGHTLFLYEENVRVPLVFWAPAIVPAGRCDRMASLVDLAPTVCDLMGLPVPAAFEGLTLIKPPVRPALFVTDYSLRLIGIRDGPWKYIYESDSGYSRLFDLRCDPNEKTNLAALLPARSLGYQRKLFEWNEGAGKPRLWPQR
jgi:hypothetical protein